MPKLRRILALWEQTLLNASWAHQREKSNCKKRKLVRPKTRAVAWFFSLFFEIHVCQSVYFCRHFCEIIFNVVHRLGGYVHSEAAIVVRALADDCEISSAGWTVRFRLRKSGTELNWPKCFCFQERQKARFLTNCTALLICCRLRSCSVVLMVIGLLYGREEIQTLFRRQIVIMKLMTQGRHVILATATLQRFSRVKRVPPILGVIDGWIHYTTHAIKIGQFFAIHGYSKYVWLRHVWFRRCVG